MAPLWKRAWRIGRVCNSITWQRIFCSLDRGNLENGREYRSVGKRSIPSSGKEADPSFEHERDPSPAATAAWSAVSSPAHEAGFYGHSDRYVIIARSSADYESRDLENRDRARSCRGLPRSICIDLMNSSGSSLHC
jgi:hypothetical protein